MLADSSYDQKIRLHALADPTLFAEQSDAIQRFVCEVLSVVPSDQHRIYISPTSAWLDYSAVGELWDRRTPPALPSKADALKAAEGLLVRLEQKCSDANRAWPDRLRGMALLPPVQLLRRAGLHAVPRPDGSGWDHWLYRAEPQLPLDGSSKTRAGVFGAQVDVRIGHRGQPISVRSRWTPLSGECKFTDLSPFQPPPGGDDSAVSDSGGGTSDPFINFLLEGAGVPQYYLAPYYFRLDGHDAEMVSASPYSLTVEVGRTKQGQESMTLTALARGGSGDYAYNWACYPIAQVEDGIREIGRGSSQAIGTGESQAIASSIEIENGTYVVLLNVRDRDTGAFKHHQQQVFASPFSSEPETTVA